MTHVYYSYDGEEMLIANATGKSRAIGKIQYDTSKKKADQFDEQKILSEIESERKKLRAAYLAGKSRTPFAQKILELVAQLNGES